MNDLSPEHIERLESAHQIFDRADGVAKARLLAALAADGPPRSRSPWKARFEVMRRNRTRMAMVATLIVALFSVWQLAQPKGVFARTVRAMIEAKGYSCDFIEVRPANGGGEDATLAGRLFWASTGELRFDGIQGGDVQDVEIRRPGGTGLSILPKAKQYSILPRTYAQEFSFGLFSHLSEYKGKAGPAVGIREIRGRKAEEFIVPWAHVVEDVSNGDARMHMWLDTETSLPVRVDLIDLGPKGGEIYRLENFHWGKQDPKLFDTTVPAGFAKLPTLDLKAEQITEYVVFGLSTFAKYNHGKYPAVKYVYGDQQGEALRKLMGMGPEAIGWVVPSKETKWSDPKAGEFAHGSYGMSWINSLQREHPECVYHGKSVTSQDADKVLLRWKLDDDEYRVIYGNLKAENVSAERLKELEAK
ncbi:hypothetical protein SAMN05444166_1404 [Singulisphaera sp. GP187]|uniref:LolA family protein n=1 Tax=Singulisphaera sp. GP187 TaxID=1882752 RepID=UPI00092CB2DF|nr:hypothetical protein [Singulisphaera sp. GP187]SIN87834.1 hypothetical protein SAMN05444166_1404 [Singulisphaera sp. GP187]